MIYRYRNITAAKNTKQVLTNATDPSRPRGKQSLIGNELLSQVNVILDNPVCHRPGVNWKTLFL